MEIKMKQSPVLRIMTAQPGEIAPDLELFKKRIAADDTELCRLIDRCGVECLKACAPKACYIISDFTRSNPPNSVSSFMTVISDMM